MNVDKDFLILLIRKTLVNFVYLTAFLAVAAAVFYLVLSLFGIVGLVGSLLIVITMFITLISMWIEEE